MPFPVELNIDSIMNSQVMFSNGIQAIVDNDLDTISPSSAPPQEYDLLTQEFVGVVNATVDPPVEQLSPGRVRYIRSHSFQCLPCTTPRPNVRRFH